MKLLIKLPKTIESILNILNENGFEAYVVGGCVRDALLNRPCADYDVCTSALPEQVQSLFEHTVPTGKKHGTITVLTPDPVEVTTFRSETSYKDHRHPDQVKFVSSIKEDLCRRDFTINAMAYHPQKGLIDPYGGCLDLKAKRVRCVGNPNQRFQEDALRMMRAHRFCAKLHFTMEKETRKAIDQNTNLIQYVAVERIRKELVQILRDDPYELEDMTQLLSKWMPELGQCKSCAQNSPWHDTDVLHHTLRAVSFLTPFDETLAFTLLFHDFGKPSTKTAKNGRDHFYGHPSVSAQIARRICRDFKMTSVQQKLIPSLIEYHDEKIPCRLKTIYTFRIQRGLSDEWMRMYFQVRICDIMSHSAQGRRTREKLDNFIRFYDENRFRPMRLQDLAVNGRDVLKYTRLTGKEIHLALQDCLRMVFYEPEKNTRSYLISYLQQRKVS